jgi:TolB-like protein/DNA-binding winged helix-turn-helix (wHTH) protein/tetratricopeptide (TPR) repeat protein
MEEPLSSRVAKGASGVRRFYEFGPFRLDPNRHRLFRGDEVVALSPKAIQTLILLVENRGKLLERETLMDALWPHVIVEDANLTVAVSQLRKVLNQNGDNAEFIETIPRVGYRFVADICEVIKEPAPLIPEEPKCLQPMTDRAEANGTTTAPPELQAKISLPAEQGRPRMQRRLIVALALCLIIAVGAIAYRFVRSSSSAPANIASVAVLPLKNLTGDPSDEYFSDGITESIISELSKIPELKVISRASVFIFKGKEIDPTEAGRRLGVASIVEGSLLKSKDRIRVQLRLVAVADGHIIWSGDSYERAAADIFEVQDEISCNVAEHLRPVFCTGKPARRSTENVAAYEAYLKGRYYMSQRTAEGLMKAIQFFQQATEVDARYALAYCGLAESYKLAVWYVPMPASEAVPELQTAAIKAIELDSSLAEAHTAMAEFYSFQWRWKESLAENERAITLNPGYGAGHHNVGLALALIGRNAEALTHIQRARELDPLSVIINTDFGWVYYLAHRYDEAIAQYQKALELDPNFTLAHFDLALAYSALSRHDQAIAEMQNARGRGSDYLAGLGYLYAVAGRRAEALAMLAELQRLAKQQYVPPYHFAWIYTGLGDKDKAIALLQEVYAEHTQHVVDFKTVPMFDSLRADERFQELVQKVGLPD